MIFEISEYFEIFDSLTKKNDIINEKKIKLTIILNFQKYFHKRIIYLIIITYKLIKKQL